MGVKVKTKINKFPVMEKAIKSINGTRICVGVSGKHAWLAGIHEYGCKIKPKEQYLTIPLTKEAANKKARDFADTFIFTSKKNKKFIARKKSKKIELLYFLSEGVTIPERSFLRAGFDNGIDEVRGKAEALLPLALSGNISESQLYETVGLELTAKVKGYAENLKSPKKSGLALSMNPDKTNPLIQTGDMVNSITYEVKKK